MIIESKTEGITVQVETQGEPSKEDVDALQLQLDKWKNDVLLASSSSVVEASSSIIEYSSSVIEVESSSSEISSSVQEVESSSSEIALSSSSSTVYSSVAEISSSSSPKISSSSDGECLLDEHIGYMREVGIFPNYTEYVKYNCFN